MSSAAPTVYTAPVATALQEFGAYSFLTSSHKIYFLVSTMSNSEVLCRFVMQKKNDSPLLKRLADVLSRP